MKLEEIQNQLRANIPLHTDHFNDWLDAFYSMVGTTATVTTTEDHDLNPGDVVNLKNVIFQNPLSSLVADNGRISAVSSVKNDMTEDYTKEIEITGATEPDFNGTFSNKIDIIDRTNFSYDSVAYQTETATGSPILLEKDLARYNGKFTVATVVSDKIYTIQYPSTFGDFTSNCSTSNFNSRIVVVYNDEHAMSLFTEEDSDKFWMYIMLGATTVSADRNIQSDHTVRWWDGEEYKQEIEETFSILVLTKANQSITPMRIQDICNIDIRNAIGLSLLGYTPEKTSSSEYSNIGLIGVDSDVWNKAVYGHMYDYATVLNLSIEDTFIPRSFALNEFTLNYNDNNTINKELIATDHNEF